jgi:hypothetical protein
MRWEKSSGFSLFEFLMASVFLGLVLISVFQGFKMISLNLIKSRALLGATALIESQLKKLEKKPLADLPISTNLVTVPGTTPPIYYDPDHYPEEILSIGRHSTRLFTYVEKVDTDANGAIVVLQPNEIETRMRRVHVTGLFQSGGTPSQVHRTSILNRVDEYGSAWQEYKTVIFNGIVTSTSGIPISNALIFLKGVYQDLPVYADFQGRFSSKIYNSISNPFCVIEAPGYERLEVYDLIFPPNASQVTRNFSLNATAFASVSGSVWKNDHLVISQVVGQSLHPITSFPQEWVEIFNPTTATWAVSGVVGLGYGESGLPDSIATTYSTVSIAPGKFYLFANISPVVVGGQSIAADAVWTPGNPNQSTFPLFVSQNNIIVVDGETPSAGVGSLELLGAGGAVLDRLGWAGSVNPGVSEGTPYPATGGIGLETGEAFRRFSSTSGVNDAFGPAYDTSNNAYNWAAGPVTLPRNSQSGALPVISGTPADGAYVKVRGDPYSSLVQASVVGTAPYVRAAFTIPQASFGAAKVMAIDSSGNGEESLVVGDESSVDLVIRDPIPYYAIRGKLLNNGVPLPRIITSGSLYANATERGNNVSEMDLSISDPNGNYAFLTRPIISNVPPYPIRVYPSINVLYLTETEQLVNLLYNSNTPSYSVSPPFGSLFTVPDISLQWNTRLIFKNYMAGTQDPVVPDCFNLLYTTVSPYVRSNPYNLTKIDNSTFMTYAQPGFVNITHFRVSNGMCMLEGPQTVNVAVPATAFNTDVFASTFTFKLIEGVIQGTARISGGAPAGYGVLVAAFSSPSNPPLAAGALPPPLPGGTGYWTTTTRADGTYRFEKLTPGFYHMYAWMSSSPDVNSVTTNREDVLSVFLSTQGIQTVDFQW